MKKELNEWAEAIFLVIGWIIGIIAILETISVWNKY